MTFSVTSRSRRFAFASSLALVSALSATARAQATPPSQPEQPAASPAAANPASAASTNPLAAPKLEAQMNALIGRTGGLTSDQAAVRARATSYDVKARHDEANAAETTVNAAGLAFIPRLTAKAAYNRISDVGPISFGTLPVAVNPTNPEAPVPAGPLTSAGVGGANTLNYALRNQALALTVPLNNYDLEATVTVPISDYVLKLSKQYSAAKHSARAARLTERATGNTAASNARILYFSWARAVLQQLVAEDALDQARAHANDAKNEYSAGKASQADVMGVDAEVAQSELLVVRAKNAVMTQEDHLRTTLHDPANAPYQIGEPLLADLPPVTGENDFAPLFDEALRKRPELMALSETATGLRKQAASDRSQLYPRLDGVGSAMYANPNPHYFIPSPVWHGSWAVGAQATWALEDAIIGGTNAANSSARASSAESQAQAMRDGIRDEVMTAWQSVREAEVAIDSTKRSLASAEESYRVRRALFRADRATSTELSDSENLLTRARFDTVNARIDLRVARVRLDHATGRDDTAPPPEQDAN